MVNNMKIIVCGDSYLSADTKYPGTHFTELLARDHEYVNLARVGCSNSLIRLQVARALQLQPDLIIVSATDHRRFEVIEQTYDPAHGLENFDYNPSWWGRNASLQWVKQAHVTGICEFVSVLKSQLGSKSKKQAWTSWVTHLMDEDWETEKTGWVIESMLATLIFSKVNFLYMPNGNLIPDWVDSKDVYTEILTELDCESDTTYHTTPDIQRELFNRVQDHLVRLNYV